MSRLSSPTLDIFDSFREREDSVQGLFVSLLCDYVAFVMNNFDAFGVFSQVVLQCTAIERHDLHNFMAATIVLIESFSLAKCLGIDFGILRAPRCRGRVQSGRSSDVSKVHRFCPLTTLCSVHCRSFSICRPCGRLPTCRGK